MELFLFIFIGTVLSRLPDNPITFPKDAVPRLPPSVLADKQELWATEGFTNFKVIDRQPGLIFVAYGIGKVRFEGLKKRPNLTLRWDADDEAVQTCLLDQHGPELCQNHINVVEKWKGKYLICGSNARQPMCRFYNLATDESEFESEFEAKSYSQSEPDKTILVQYIKSNGTSNGTTNRYMFFAKELDKGGSIIRTSLSKDGFLELKENALSTNGPVRFIKMIDIGEHVLIFFREVLDNGDEVSRVGTICKNDEGGSLSVLTNKFSTFVKTSLKCPVTENFDFSLITAVSDPVTIQGKGPTVLASFTSPRNGIPGSNVCAFVVEDIKAALFGHEVIFAGTEEAPWRTAPKGNPARCLEPAKTQQHAYQYLQYIDRSSTETDHIPTTLDGTHLLIRTTFPKPEERDLITQVEVQPLTNNDEAALVVMATTNGKLLRGTLMLRPIDVNKIVTEVDRFELLSETDLFIPGECTTGSRGVNDLELLTSKGEMFISMPGCDVRVKSNDLCGSFHCEQSCQSSGDPGCSWRDGACSYSALLAPNPTTHQDFSECPKKPQIGHRSPPIVQPDDPPMDDPELTYDTIVDNGDTYDTIDDNGDTDDAIDGASTKSTTIWLMIMLVVGIVIGVIIQKIHKRCANTNSGNSKEPEMTDLSQAFINGEFPGSTLQKQKSERIPSVYENQQRVESTSSDSSRDSGIRSSEEEQIASSRKEVEYKTGLYNGMTTRDHQIPGANTTSMHYSTVGRRGHGVPSPHFQYNTTSRAPMLTMGSKTKLGTSSLRHYSTMGARPTYQRSESCPRPGIMPEVPHSPTRGNQHYPILRSNPTQFNSNTTDNPANIYSTVNVDVDSTWTGYQQNNISVYATLPKGQKRAQIRRTPSTTNGTLPRQKPIPVLPPTVNHVFNEK